MKVKTHTISKALREYKYCAHANLVISDMHVSCPVPVAPRKVSSRVATSHSPPLAKLLLKAQQKSEQSKPSSCREPRFPPATSAADRRRCCVGCFAKMIDSFLNNCS
ncbi:uncharacterized protein LOC115440929 [Manduca sexta]|uniref:uncharacterized protein LOC115440929 n=1 Tax=Manduca sexta TaxID=7130 RepID=UPI0018900C0B|nr:uncharacterized protein LOC115440929 [Manduca sexta]